MPRTAHPWFRIWSGALLSSRKVYELTPPLFRYWTYLMCLANEHTPRGRLPNIGDVAFALKVSDEKAKAIMAKLIELRFIDVEGQHYVMHDWDDWQMASDANLTPGRRGRHVEGTPLEPVSPAVGTPLERATRAVGTPLERLDLEGDTEGEKDKETEGEQDAQARAPTHPFTIAFSKHFQERNAGRPPAATQHAEAIALETEHGADWCFQAAEAFDWLKPPSYLRPWIVDHKAKAASGEATPVGATAAPRPPSRRYAP